MIDDGVKGYLRDSSFWVAGCALEAARAKDVALKVARTKDVKVLHPGRYRSAFRRE